MCHHQQHVQVSRYSLRIGGPLVHWLGTGTSIVRRNNRFNLINRLPSKNRKELPPYSTMALKHLHIAFIMIILHSALDVVKLWFYTFLYHYKRIIPRWLRNLQSVAKRNEDDRD